MDVVFAKWYPHPELNRDQRFRKPLLYPFELWRLRCELIINGKSSASNIKQALESEFLCGSVRGGDLIRKGTNCRKGGWDEGWEGVVGGAVVGEAAVAA